MDNTVKIALNKFKVQIPPTYLPFKPLASLFWKAPKFLSLNNSRIILEDVLLLQPV